ncbi:IS30 family transposase, partial [Leucothrix arctica]
MSTHYRQLTQAQRYQIWSLRETKHNLRQIGCKVGVHYSTVSRELRRNKSANGYEAASAHLQSIGRQKEAAKHHKVSDKTDDFIRKGLCLGWSPESISQRMKREGVPQKERLSHSTIYHRIKRDKHQGGVLYQALPCYGKTRWKGGKRNRKAGVNLIPNRKDISERPAIVDKRTRLGDWEGDTIHGQSAYLVTL